MKSTKKREIGLGDNLYGIPLNDILSPEQIEKMKQNPPSARRRKVKAEQKRRSEKRRNNSPKFKIPEINMSPKMMYIIGAIAATLILLLILKNPISVRIMPKLYVSEAMGNSVSLVKKELGDAVENIFGFDISDAKKMTVTAKGTIGADSSGVLSNLAMNIQAGYSKKAKNATGMWQYLHNDEEFASATVYLNDEEIGFNVPQLFGEYWVAPPTEFGNRWNESGLRKALYAETIGEDADLSFTNIFENRALMSEKGVKEAKQLTEKLYSGADAKYNGRTEIIIDGKSKSARQFRFTFDQGSINEYLISMMQLILNDSESSEVLSYSGKLENIKALFDDLTGRLTNNISITDATMYIAEYKGEVRNITLKVAYTENGANPSIMFSVSTESPKNIIDTINASFDFFGGDKNISYLLKSSGNHIGKGKLFTDNTSLKMTSGDYSYSFDNEITLDFKEGITSGKMMGTDNYTSKALSYSGKCASKKGFVLELSEMWASVTGEVNRNLTGSGYFELKPDMLMSKVNTTNKKMILDYSKAEAENYLKRLEETDSVKNFLAKIDSIFKAEER